MNPRALAALTDEVRTTFSSEEEINLISVQGLSYMLAVLDETLRMHPPVPSGQPRLIAEGGDVILGRYVPAGVSTSPVFPRLCTKGELSDAAIPHRPRPKCGSGPCTTTPRAGHDPMISSPSAGSETRLSRATRRRLSRPSQSVLEIALGRSKQTCNEYYNYL